MRTAALAGLLAGVALAPHPVWAEMEAPKAERCAPTDAALPPELAPWTARTTLHAASDAAGLRAAVLAPGQAVSATLHPTRSVTYGVQPEKPGGSVAYGGLFSLPIARAGTYRIVLGSGAWIDVLDGKKALASVAHKPGPACSTARKTVDFALSARTYTVQISANADPALAILVISLP